MSNQLIANDLYTDAIRRKVSLPIGWEIYQEWLSQQEITVSFRPICQEINRILQTGYESIEKENIPLSPERIKQLYCTREYFKRHFAIIRTDPTNLLDYTKLDLQQRKILQLDGDSDLLPIWQTVNFLWFHIVNNIPEEELQEMIKNNHPHLISPQKSTLMFSYQFQNKSYRLHDIINYLKTSALSKNFITPENHVDPLDELESTLQQLEIQ
jgi:hypothetical protein